MARGISIEESGRRYAEKSLRCFIEGGKYARDGKAKSIRWLVGVINSSGATLVELKEILDKARRYTTIAEEEKRYGEAKGRIEEIIGNRSV